MAGRRLMRCATRLFGSTSRDLLRSVTWNVLSGKACDDRQLLMIARESVSCSEEMLSSIKTSPATSTSALVYPGTAQVIRVTVQPRVIERPTGARCNSGQDIISGILYGKSISGARSMPISAVDGRDRAQRRDWPQ